MCITTIVYHESLWTTSLALSDNNKLWIWNKPWESPYTELSNMAVMMFVGAVIGFSIGFFLCLKS